MCENRIKTVQTGLRKLLRLKGRKVYIKRVNRWTKELIGVSVEFGVTDEWRRYFNPRNTTANEEIFKGFQYALNILRQDSTARYAIGYPPKLSDDVLFPCIALVQILRREVPIAIFYFRSLDIENFPSDVAACMKAVYDKFKRGKIIIFVGSLHEYVNNS